VFRQAPSELGGFVVNARTPDEAFIPPGTMVTVAHVYKATSPAPFVVVCHELTIGEPPGTKGRLRYYLWLFGPTIQIHERRISEEEVFASARH
jgi:hypothetical protein